jgi:hypothetical protein
MARHEPGRLGHHNTGVKTGSLIINELGAVMAVL